MEDKMAGKMEQANNFTYIVECRDGSFYTGWTTDLEHRVAVHNAGKGAKYTKSRRPVKLVYFEAYPTKQEAMRREWEIKQLVRDEKKKMIEDFQSRRDKESGAGIKNEKKREEEKLKKNEK